ncbi:hypothetical protein ABZ079_15805 [Streptomyces sp. NPDC006314]|uniref:hypothetical protein n=1 Tax=Streptomyces sp. NPDC006314 TaxID=3154475 RepID=UPI00339F7ACB
MSPITVQEPQQPLSRGRLGLSFFRFSLFRFSFFGFSFFGFSFFWLSLFWAGHAVKLPAAGRRPGFH